MEDRGGHYPPLCDSWLFFLLVKVSLGYFAYVVWGPEVRTWIGAPSWFGGSTSDFPDTGPDGELKVSDGLVFMVFVLRVVAAILCCPCFDFLSVLL